MIEILKKKLDLVPQLLILCSGREIMIKFLEILKQNFPKKSRFKTSLNFFYTDSLLCYPLFICLFDGFEKWLHLGMCARLYLNCLSR